MLCVAVTVMSTKNLARTIIEGGRAPHNKWERAQSHRDERALTRAYLERAARVEDGFETLAIGLRPKVYKGFADKLGPPRRWLRSRVGRPWSKVRAEMFERFDPRSLAGQHILFDHMLQEVRMWSDDRIVFRWRQDLFVDRHGILRAAPGERRTPPLPRGKQLRDTCEIEAWASGRRVGGQGEALFWYVVARCCELCVRRRDRCCCPRSGGEQVHGPHAHYRQDRRLDLDELAFWHSLVKDAQAACGLPSRS